MRGILLWSGLFGVLLCAGMWGFKSLQARSDRLVAEEERERRERLAEHELLLTEGRVIDRSEDVSKGPWSARSNWSCKTRGCSAEERRSGAYNPFDHNKSRLSGDNGFDELVLSGITVYGNCRELADLGQVRMAMGCISMVDGKLKEAPEVWFALSSEERARLTNARDGALGAIEALGHESRVK